jgi:hypothetical protein
MIMICDPTRQPPWDLRRGAPIFVFMVTDEREESARNARRRLIIVGVNGSAAAEAAAQWAVREAELRKDDVLLVPNFSKPANRFHPLLTMCLMVTMSISTARASRVEGLY